jgi:hypothetical protein
VARYIQRRLWGAETGFDAFDLWVHGSSMLGWRASSLLVLWSLLYLVVGRVFQFLVLLGRGDRVKEIEILVLRHQVAVLRRQVNRPDLGDGGRVLLAALSRLLRRPSWNIFFVSLATLLRWQRGLVARKWTYPRKRLGRPSARTDIRDAVLCLARENPGWGYQRIGGGLAGAGIRVPPSTVRDILKRAGLDPAPRRDGPTWSQFLQAQAEGIWACDLFHIDPVFLKRIYVLFFIRTRKQDRPYHGRDNGPDCPDWAVGCSAGPGSAHGPGRASRAHQVPRPGPRRQVHACLRRAVHLARREGHQGAGPVASRERDRGTLGGQPYGASAPIGSSSTTSATAHGC